MHLTSIEFLLFVAVVAVGYYLLAGKAKRIFLVIASLVFYGTLGLRYIPLLLGIVFFIYGAGFWIQSANGRKRGRISAMVVVLLLLVLGSLKYINFTRPIIKS